MYSIPKNISRWFLVWMLGLLGICGVPLVGWGVNIGGQVGLADKAKNQPSARVQISGTFRPSTPTGGFDFDEWQIGPLLQWGLMDKEPPPYTEADSEGNFTIPLKTSIDPADTMGMTPLPPLPGSLSGTSEEQAANGSESHILGTPQFDPTDGQSNGNSGTTGSHGNQGGQWHREGAEFLNLKLSYRISAGYDGYYAEQTLDSDKLLAARLALNPKLSINNFSSYIDFWREGFDAEGAGQLFEQQTGNSVLTWEKYFGDGQAKPWLSTAWAPPDGIRNDFNWGLGKEHWIGSENNAVTNIAPAQGLYPHTWPMNEEANPLPVAYYRRTHHE